MLTCFDFSHKVSVNFSIEVLFIFSSQCDKLARSKHCRNYHTCLCRCCTAFLSVVCSIHICKQPVCYLWLCNNRAKTASGTIDGHGQFQCLFAPGLPRINGAHKSFPPWVAMDYMIGIMNYFSQILFQKWTSPSESEDFQSIFDPYFFH